MPGTLLVTEPTRSYGEYRKPWVRRLHRRYLAGYRGRLTRAIECLVGAGELGLLTARDLVDESRVPVRVTRHYYDEASLKVDAQALKRRTHRLMSGWWPRPGQVPGLDHRGIWLPELLTLVRGVVMQLEVTEPLAVVERTIAEAAPDRVVLLSGASVGERLARVVAERRGIPVEVAEPRLAAPRVHARFLRALQVREERLRLRDFLDFPRRPRTAAGPPGARRLLFVTCRARHHFVVDPLAAAVRAAGAEPHVLATPVPDPELHAKVAALEREGVACSNLADYLPAREARGLARRRAVALRRAWRRLGRAPGFAQGFEVDGLPLAPFVVPLHRDSMTRSLPLAALFQEAALRALDAIAPEAVVITSNRRYAERAVALAARARGVPCLLFSGTLLPGKDRYDFLDLADRLLVIGDHLKEAIVREEGVDPRLVSVVGDPRSNAARLVQPAKLRQEVARDFGLSADAPVVVGVSKYVSRFFAAAEKEAFYRTLVAALPLLPGAQVIVKVHPNEHLPTLQAQAREWGWPDARLTKDYDIHRLFGAADAAVMVTSMAGIEAMALGCPVVAVQAAGKDYEGDSMPPYVSEGVAERVDMGDAAGLARALARLLNDPGRREALVERGRKFAARYVHPVDGELGGRLLAVAGEVRRGARRPGTIRE